MIVWGGFSGFASLNDGGRYDPQTDAWKATTATGAPVGRDAHQAAWTGTEMVVWGGEALRFQRGILNLLGTFEGDGGRYDPVADAWTGLSTAGGPTAYRSYVSVWTGSDMIVWGGAQTDSAGRYDPVRDAWTGVTPTSAPSTRYDETAVWTDTEMILWGGYWGLSNFDTGGRYSPADGWSRVTTNGAPEARGLHTGAWTGREMIVWGGAVLSDNGHGGFAYAPVAGGGRYTP
jgi:N-acetylneuraminic acid mutarotase